MRKSLFAVAALLLASGCAASSSSPPRVTNVAWSISAPPETYGQRVSEPGPAPAPRREPSVERSTDEVRRASFDRDRSRTNRDCRLCR